MLTELSAYLTSTTSGFKDKDIRKLDFVAINQFVLLRIVNGLPDIFLKTDQLQITKLFVSFLKIKIKSQFTVFIYFVYIFK